MTTTNEISFLLSSTQPTNWLIAVTAGCHCPCRKSTKKRCGEAVMLLLYLWWRMLSWCGCCCCCWSRVTWKWVRVIRRSEHLLVHCPPAQADYKQNAPRPQCTLVPLSRLLVYVAITRSMILFYQRLCLHISLKRLSACYIINCEIQWHVLHILILRHRWVISEWIRIHVT